MEFILRINPKKIYQPSPKLRQKILNMSLELITNPDKLCSVIWQYSACTDEKLFLHIFDDKKNAISFKIDRRLKCRCVEKHLLAILKKWTGAYIFISSTKEQQCCADIVIAKYSVRHL